MGSYRESAGAKASRRVATSVTHNRGVVRRNAPLNLMRPKVLVVGSDESVLGRVRGSSRLLPRQVLFFGVFARASPGRRRRFTYTTSFL